MTAGKEENSGKMLRPQLSKTFVMNMPLRIFNVLYERIASFYNKMYSQFHGKVKPESK